MQSGKYPKSEMIYYLFRTALPDTTWQPIESESLEEAAAVIANQLGAAGHPPDQPIETTFLRCARTNTKGRFEPDVQEIKLLVHPAKPERLREFLVVRETMDSSGEPATSLARIRSNIDICTADSETVSDLLNSIGLTLDEDSEHSILDISDLATCPAFELIDDGLNAASESSLNGRHG